MATALGWSRRETVGALLDVWDWVDEETADGSLPGMTLKMIAEAVAVSEEFLLAMVQVDWLTVAEMGIVVPKFDRWLGRSAKKRLQNNETKRLSRSKGDKSETTEQNRTEQNKGEVSPSTPLCGPGTEPPTRPRKERTRDTLFDAIAEVTASDPAATGSYIGRVCKALRSADPPYTAAEVLQLVEIAPVELPWLKGRLTLGLVEQFIGRVRASPLAPKVTKGAFEEALRRHKGGKA